MARADNYDNTLWEFTVVVMSETIRGTQMLSIYKQKAKTIQDQKFIAL